MLNVTTVYFFFQSNSEICYNELSTVAGLNPVMPSGAMYLMVSSQHSHRLMWNISRYLICWYDFDLTTEVFY